MRYAQKLTMSQLKQLQSNWNQGKSTQNEETEVKKEEPPMTPKSPAPKPPSSPVATQTPGITTSEAELLKDS